MSKITYRPEIDGLRALAVIPVILYHAEIDRFSGGYVGVDVFFVLSGYLITSILMVDLQSKNFSLKSFYERRARRILPALFVVMLATIPFAWMWLPGSEMKDFAQSLVATTVFGSNILFYLESGYFDTDSELKPLLHTWSLGVEEQFYLVFPVLLMVIWRFGRNWIAPIILLLAVISLSTSQWAVSATPTAGFYLLHTRFWELALGALAALILLRLGRGGTHLIKEGAGWIGLALIAFAVFAFDESTPSPGLLALIPTVGTLLIILFAREGTFVNRLLSSKILVGVGLMSYSAYLWHNPIFALAKRFEPFGNETLLTISLISLTGFLSFLSWKYVEVPFRNRQLTPFPTPIFVSLIVAAALISFGLWGHFSGGFKTPAGSPQGIPETSVISDSDYLVLGDSHAAHLIFGLTELTTGDVTDKTSAGCIPLRDVDRYDSRFEKGNCAKIMNSHLDALIAEDPDAVVVLGSMGPVYLDGTAFNGFDEARVTGLGVDLITEPSITDRWLVFEKGLFTTFNELSKLQKAEVIFSIDIPELGQERGCLNDQKALDLGFFVLTDWVPSPSTESCVLSRNSYDERASRYKALVYRVAKDFPKIQVFDPTELFCDTRFCGGVDSQGRALYRDADHLSEAGSLYVAEALIKGRETE